MSEKIQKRGETINDYVHEKYRLCRALKLSFSEIKKQILIGIYDTMLAKTHGNIDDLIDDLIEYEKIENTRLERIRNQGHKLVHKTEMQKDRVGTNRNERKLLRILCVLFVKIMDT